MADPRTVAEIIADHRRDKESNRIAPHHPLPWHVERTEGIDDIRSSNGQYVADFERPTDAALILDRVNGWDTLVAESARLREALTDLVDWLEDNKMTIDGEFSMAELLAPARAALSARSLEVE